MRILKLTDRLADRLLTARRRSDRTADRAVARVVADVRRRRDAALLAWTRRLDDPSVKLSNLWMKPEELEAASKSISPDMRRALERAALNIRRVAKMQKPRSRMVQVEPGVRLGMLVRPLESVGCYVPGGRHSLISTLLMMVIPAQVAGVRRIVVVSPRPSTVMLAAASLLGIQEVARVGGAQAIAALAYGTKTVPRVDKIVGPGNRYVTAAKRLVSGDCSIDFLAGPTELLVVAERGNPRSIAADLLAQAEHDPGALALLLTPSTALARAVLRELTRQLRALPRSNPAWRSLARPGPILLARTRNEAVQFANRFAPEHLSLPGAEPALLEQVEAAGSVFVGAWSAQPLGDYATGSNHVLPTGGLARARGGLSVADFVKCISVQRISRAGLRRLAPVASTLAQAEQLLAHQRAVELSR